MEKHTFDPYKGYRIELAGAKSHFNYRVYTPAGHHLNSTETFWGAKWAIRKNIRLCKKIAKYNARMSNG